jgi:RNA polymerase sigma factor (sigma-70 family)
METVSKPLVRVEHMAQTQLAAVIRHIRKLAATADAEPSDRHLLEGFATLRDEAAFAALVQRHGGMVLGVARRVLGHEQDAEDAFQATFLILARKARLIRQDSVGAWLHQVAHRVALKARRLAAKRKQKERRETGTVSPSSLDDVTWRELRVLLDEELAKLPDQQRQALVLCCLEGVKHAAAARQLGWTVATLRRRLGQGRELLRARLVRRGLTLSAALVTMLAAERAAPAAVPAMLHQSTVRAASGFAVGKALGVIVSAEVASLTERGLHTMFATKLRIAAALLVLLGVLIGAAALTQASPKPQAVKEAKPRAAKEETEDVIEVSGRVLDPDGKPVAGAKLFLPRRLKEQVGSTDEIDITQRGTTDKQGRFSLKLLRKETQTGRAVSLIAAADGFGLGWEELARNGKQREVTLRLVKDIPIRGRLVTTEGKPIPNAAVQVVGVMVPKDFDDFLKAYQRGVRHLDEGTGLRQLAGPLTKVINVPASDKDGRFQVAGAGVGRLVVLEVKHAAMAQSIVPVVTREGLDIEPINKAILQNLGARRDAVPLLYGLSFEYVVEPTRIIQGTVREAGSGKPVAGATVQTAGVTSVTDVEGRYRLAGMRKAQDYMLLVEAPKERPLIGRWVRMASPAALAPVKADVELIEGVIVTGRVYDKSTGKGVQSQLHFSALPGNKHIPQEQNLALFASADSEGRFRLVTIPGPGVLLASVPGTHLKINGVPIYPYKPAEFSAEDRKRVTMSDDLKPRRAFLVASGGAEDLDLSNACKVLDVKEGSEPVSCDLAVDPGKTLTVHLQDPAGKPLTGVTVAGISAMVLRAVPLKTAMCPVYALDPEKPRELLFIHSERKLAALATVRGDEKEPLTVRLFPGATITGRLLDANGEPVADAEAYAFYKTPVGQQLNKRPSHPGQPWTDKNGRFRMEGVIADLQFHLVFRVGNKMKEPEKRQDIKLDSGKTLDLGEIRLKAPRE